MRSCPVPPADIGPELFLQFRSPRRGSGNPEPMTNPVWVWSIEHNRDGWSTNGAFDGPPSEEAGPCWSFGRYGRTETKLPDGRLIRIGGEYEDWYDADFYIYNDVIVTDAAGRTEIFGYSEEAFPPTDFHTATLVDDRIIVIGNLSYPEHRKHKAQLLVLDTSSYRVERIDATGEGPPWLYSHSSELVENGGAILVRGGMIIDPRWPASVENIDDWRLDLNNRRWERLTRRAWPRFVFLREDGAQNHLHWLRDLLRDRTSGKPDSSAGYRAECLSDLGASPRLDLLETLYSPDVPHAKVPEMDDESDVYRLSIQGVTVRYVEDSNDIGLTIEGTLPKETVELLRSDLLAKLQAIENSSINCIDLMVD